MFLVGLVCYLAEISCQETLTCSTCFYVSSSVRDDRTIFLWKFQSRDVEKNKIIKQVATSIWRWRCQVLRPLQHIFKLLLLSQQWKPCHRNILKLLKLVPVKFNLIAYYRNRAYTCLVRLGWSIRPATKPINLFAYASLGFTFCDWATANCACVDGAECDTDAALLLFSPRNVSLFLSTVKPQKPDKQNSSLKSRGCLRSRPSERTVHHGQTFNDTTLLVNLWPSTAECCFSPKKSKKRKKQRAH